MIRLGTHEDIPELVELGRNFLNATILAETIPYDPYTVINFLGNIIDHEDSILFVIDSEGIKGMIFGCMVPVYWNSSFLTAQQIGFYVSPEARGKDSIRLFDAFEKWGIDNGAKTVTSGAKKDKRFEKMNNMLSRRGYLELETIHMKKV